MDRGPEKDGGFAGSASILANAQGVNISGGDFRAIQGQYVNVFHGGVHNHPEGGIKPNAEKAIWKALEAVPNFRKIYQDMLSKATEGTGMWLLKNDRFRIWLEANGDIKIFWGSGNPGAGKTVLASLVIQRLETLYEESPNQICVCYFYFRYSDSVGLTVRNVLETLLKQTLERHSSAFTFVEKEYSRHMREGTQPSEAELLGVLRKFTDKMAATFYVLDALDEAPPLIRNAIIRSLSSLKVKLFITSRPLETVQELFPQAHTFCIAAHEDDIELHISKGINDSPGLRNLVGQEGRWLQEEIMTTVKRKSSGMFLHASLQMDALRPCISLHQTRRILQDFPSQIDGAYLQTWRRILDEGEECFLLAKSVFLWILNAERSMTLQELQRAAATSPHTFKFEADRLVPGVTLIAMCRGLLVVEEESQIVRLVHYTAKKLLEELLQSSFPHPHSLLATACITHLREQGLQNSTIASEKEFAAALQADPLLAYVSDAWAFHLQQSLDTGSVKEIAAVFVRDITSFPAFTSRDHASEFDLLGPLHTIALYHLPLDLLSGLGDVNVMTRVVQQSSLILACQSSNRGMTRVLIEDPNIQVNQTKKSGVSPLMTAAQNGDDSVATLLLAHPRIQVNQANNGGLTALMVAAQYGHESVATPLLAHPEIQVNQANNFGHTAFMVAAEEGRESVFTLLLAHPKTQVNQANNLGWTALIVAAEKGQESVATLLLACPELQVNQANTDGWTALMLAAQNGHDAVATLLLARPEIQVNQANNNGFTALIFAAQNGHDAVATLLLARPEIQVNQANNNGWTALMIAAQNGHVSAATLLLARPEIQVNLANNNGLTALMVAAQYGHESVATLLLAHPEILVNQTTHDEWTALMAAATNGHDSIATLLLAHPKIQVTQANNFGNTALMVAAEEGQESVFTLFLAHPETQVNQANNNGWTALMIAAQNSYVSAATLLLARPEIQVNHVSNNGWTALMSAAKNGHECVATLLLTRPDVQVNLLDIEGDSALMLAASNGYDGVLTALLAHPGIQVNQVDSNGDSSLLIAAQSGHNGAVTILLGHSETQVNLVDNSGYSALMLASEYGHQAVCSTLLDTHMFDVNSTNPHGTTALLLASQYGHESIVCLLLGVPGIDYTMQDNDGDTAMSIAQERGHTGIVNLLREHIASSGLLKEAEAQDEDPDSDDSESEEFYDAEES